VSSIRHGPLCEIHVPIAPTPSFFARVQLLAASVRRFAGALSDSPVIVTVSRDVEPYDLAGALAWSEPLGIEWRWVEREIWDRHGMFGTAFARMTYDFRSPYVLQIDADTLCTGPLDTLLPNVGSGLGGVIAMLPPTSDLRHLDGRDRTARQFWADLFAHAGLASPRLECWHVGPGIAEWGPEHCACPPYFNLGVLAASREATRTLGEVVFRELDLVRSFVDSRFSCQIAVPLALARSGLPWTELPLRWNFPNNRWIWDHYGAEAHDVRILHYWESDEFDRERDILGAAQLDSFLSRDALAAPNRLLQERLRWLREDLGDLVGV
jgi:hypothetical protein